MCREMIIYSNVLENLRIDLFGIDIRILIKKAADVENQLWSSPLAAEVLIPWSKRSSRANDWAVVDDVFLGTDIG